MRRLAIVLGLGLLATPAASPGAAQAPPGQAAPAPIPTQAPFPTQARGPQVKSGTGFFVSPENVLLTSAHVVTDCAAIPASAADGMERTGSILAMDRDLDLAMLLVSGAPPTQYLPDVDTQARVGDRLYALGYGILTTEPFRPFYFSGTLRGENTLANGSKVLVVNSYIPSGTSGAAIVDPQARLVGAIIGRYTAEPDQGVVIPARAIREFAQRHGVSLGNGASLNDAGREGRGHDEVLLGASALVQCRPK